MKGEEPVVGIYERRVNKKEIKKMKLYFFLRNSEVSTSGEWTPLNPECRSQA